MSLLVMVKFLSSFPFVASVAESVSFVGCWGILNGPGTGACMAELILEGQASSVDLEPFKP